MDRENIDVLTTLVEKYYQAENRADRSGRDTDARDAADLYRKFNKVPGMAYYKRIGDRPEGLLSGILDALEVLGAEVREVYTYDKAGTRVTVVDGVDGDTLAIMIQDAGFTGSLDSFLKLHPTEAK